MTSIKRSPKEPARNLRVLFLVPYPREGASNRIRIEQYIPHLECRGISCRIRPFVNRPFYRILYLPHRYAAKAFWFVVCTANRLLDLARALRYDLVFVHREAYPFGGAFIESALHHMGKPIVFDFDDSIFIPSTSQHNIYIERFKKPGKTADIIRMSRAVIAGNEYLRQYARAYNKDVVVIPSAIDTAKYCPAPAGIDREEVVIGWIGSATTRAFLYSMKDVFSELSRLHRNVVIKIVGDGVYGFEMRNVVNKQWALDDEVDDLRGFDIGIMPMPDNEWTKGKCGFKNIVYMSLGIPVVCSPVGVNAEIVQDGVTGYLASTPADWLDRLSRLIRDRALRRRMGTAGRDRARRFYSVEANAEKVADVIRKAGGRA